MVKYGFREIVDRLGLARGLGFNRKVRPLRTAAGLGMPERLRLACEELGPTFVKLAQVLSTRPDIIPPELVHALGGLQENVRPMESTEVRSQIEEELGGAPSDIFKRFAAEPAGSASIAQVHRAVLPDGSQVAVKIQRPYIEQTVESDIDILLHIARALEQHVSELTQYDPVAIFEEFARTLRQELDFVREARNMEVCRSNFHAYDSVRIPRVHWDYTTPRCLTMDFIEGERVETEQDLRMKGFDPSTLAERAVHVYLKMILEDGFFQADPHPGNLRAIENNVLGILDYGMFCRVDEEMRDLLVEIFMSMSERESRRVVDIFEQMEMLREGTDVEGLKRDLEDMLATYYGVEISKIPWGKANWEFLGLIQRYHIQFPRELTSLMRALAALEGLALSIDPGLNLAEHIEPFAQRLLIRRYSPYRVRKQIRTHTRDLFRLLSEFPRRMNSFLRRLGKGQIKLRMDREQLDSITYSLNRATNRLSISVILAALIIGSSLLLVTAGATVGGILLALGWLGLGVAVMLGLWLAYSVFRTGGSAR
jgi:ubiquinone biosynthesis protein